MVDTTVNACNFLENLQRFDLAILLRLCNTRMTESEVDNGFYTDLIDQAVVEAPTPIAEALKKLPPQDRKRIAEAIASLYPNRNAPEDISVTQTNITVTNSSAAQLAELFIHREMMIDVATGGERIQEVDDYYRAREVRIRQAIPKNVKYENSHADLWDWYRYWSTNLPQYRDRRHYVREIFAPVIEAMSKRSSLPSEPRELTGWERVDRALAKARLQVQTASAEEDCQAIGLLCREVRQITQILASPKVTAATPFNYLNLR